MHIPLIIRHPRIPGGVRSSALVSNLDIMPTILEDAGLDCSCDGESLFPVLEGRSAGREAFLMEFHGIRFLYTQRALLRSDGMKYIWSPGDFDELYDLNNDPAEIRNLIDDEAFSSRRDEMIALLKEQVVRYRDPVMDYVHKILGSWESPSGQVDATNSRYNG